MGTDLRTITPSTLSIYSNPAILAMSQTPFTAQAARIWQKPRQPENETASEVLYTADETSLWVAQGEPDYFVAFLNAGPATASMVATPHDIFNDAFTQGKKAAPALVAMSWDIHDLWANRMDDATAGAVIKGNATMAGNGTAIGGGNATVAAMRYNATEMSYADGVEANSSALLGQMVGVVGPGKSLTAKVPSHGVVMYRLRPRGGGGMSKRDEL